LALTLNRQNSVVIQARHIKLSKRFRGQRQAVIRGGNYNDAILSAKTLSLSTKTLSLSTKTRLFCKKSKKSKKEKK
jgi:hypothetical protein